MQQFAGSGDGYAYEVAVRAAVSQLKEHFPDIDQASVEAHLMLARTYTTLVDMRAPYWTQFGITGPRFMILRLLFLAAGQRASMSEIAADLNKGMANVTQLVDGLVQDDLVERGVALQDRRIVQARLTPRGAALFSSVFPENAARIAEAWAPLTDQEKLQLVDLLSRVRLNLVSP
jgi:DNA-binding MarR family transcriptional regulator